MDEKFFKQRARQVRELASKVDPFIKKRLLDLADRYDARIGRPSRATPILLYNLPHARASSASEVG